MESASNHPGRLPSDLDRPGGSLMLGMLASERLWPIRSFSSACLVILPGPWLQESPCVPSAATSMPQRQVCGWQMLTPRRSPTAILIASSSNRRLHDETGSARSQSPACGAETALHLALSDVLGRELPNSSTTRSRS